VIMHEKRLTGEKAIILPYFFLKYQGLFGEV